MLRMTHCRYFLASAGMQKMIVLYALKGKSICPSNLQKQIMPVNQHRVDFDGTNHSSRDTRALNSLLRTRWLVLSDFTPSLSLSFSLSPLYLLCQYDPRTHHWHALLHSASRKTQSLKNKYIMPIAVKQVGVVAVWAFRLTQTDSYFYPLTECIYSKPPPTLWIPGIDFLILKLNEL